MFPWDMGDVELLDASFGKTGSLFSFPTLESPPSTLGTASKARRTRTRRRCKKRGILELTEYAEDNKISNRSCGISREDDGGDGENKDAVDIHEAKGDTQEPRGSLSLSVKTWSGQSGPVFHPEFQFTGHGTRSNPAYHVTWRTRRPAAKAAVRQTRTF